MAASGSLSDAELDREYNVRLLRDDFDDIVAGWFARSEAFREGAEARLDLAYGPGERERLDLFLCGDRDAPLLFYIHGGYWQRGDKAMYSFVAEPFVENGVNVAVVNYELCPAGSIGGITAQIRGALAWLWREADGLGFARERIHVTGHSAGGHLTAMAMATDWPSLGDGLPGDLVKGGIPISGLYELEPLRRTTINDAVAMDADEAAAYSPQFLVPATMAPALVVVGGGETSQFHRQTERFIAAWAGHGVPVEHLVVPEVDHFDVVNRLTDSTSDFFSRVLERLA